MTGIWIVTGCLIVVVAGLVILLVEKSRKVDVLQKKQKQYHDIVNQSLETFAHAIDAKDQNTNGHSQRVIIRNHPTIGGEILKDFTAIQGISDGARYHHERYDGNGYNEGLKGKEIPLAARIICVADSYDTMSSKRVYKELHEENYILSELDRCSGKQFDPAIVPFMIEMIKDGTAPLPRPDYKSR